MWPFKNKSNTVVDNNGGIDRANELVVSYGRHIGVSDAQLDSNNDRSFGEYGFHYDKDRDILIARAFVAKAMIKTAGEQGQENYRLMEKVLNDPKIGGMFEQNGGYFILDEEKETYFLVKEFPVVATSPQSLRFEMEDLQNLAAVWRVRWFARVAKIMHGNEPAPTIPVTRKNDLQ